MSRDLHVDSFEIWLESCAETWARCTRSPKSPGLGFENHDSLPETWAETRAGYLDLQGLNVQVSKVRRPGPTPGPRVGPTAIILQGLALQVSNVLRSGPRPGPRPGPSAPGLQPLEV